jgi:hypothetical protein
LGRFREHAWCQSVIVLLNFAVIVITMIPSFRVHVSPKIPLRLDKAYYVLATVHAALGSVTEVAGLCILLAAGTSVLPQKFRITKYKAWMNCTCALVDCAFVGIGNLRPLVRTAFVSEMKSRRLEERDFSVVGRNSYCSSHMDLIRCRSRACLTPEICQAHLSNFRV